MGPKTGIGDAKRMAHSQTITQSMVDTASKTSLPPSLRDLEESEGMGFGKSVGGIGNENANEKKHEAQKV